TEAGLDPQALLTHINRDRLANPAIRDVGAYTAYSLRRVAERQIDEQHEAERRVEQQHEAATLLRHSWQHLPQAAETIITGTAFQFVADELAQLHADGQDTATVLSSLSPEALLDTPHPSGATAHALKQHRRDEAVQEPAEPKRLSEQQHQRLVATARATVETTVDASTLASAPDDQDGNTAERDRLATVTSAAAQYYQQQLAAYPSERAYLAS